MKPLRVSKHVTGLDGIDGSQFNEENLRENVNDMVAELLDGIQQDQDLEYDEDCDEESEEDEEVIGQSFPKRVVEELARMSEDQILSRLRDWIGIDPDDEYISEEERAQDEELAKFAKVMVKKSKEWIKPFDLTTRRGGISPDGNFYMSE